MEYDVESIQVKWLQLSEDTVYLTKKMRTKFQASFLHLNNTTFTRVIIT